jgi:hypothetical protein
MVYLLVVTDPPIVAIIILLLAWRILPAFIEGYRGKKGGFFAALGTVLARKLKH